LGAAFGDKGETGMSDANDRPGVWFSLLCDAIWKRDVATVKRSQQELKRLDVEVKFGISAILRLLEAHANKTPNIRQANNP
jgi:hypothetical protein